mmetsp:Transcript_459/g.1552  ORF Transcript_459/g.1552 Transcript_459/m.1552 type:complete len:83 (-) Transcript_459:69-317(-)
MPAAGRLEKRASDVSRARVIRSSGPAPFPAAKARARGVRGHAARTGATGGLDDGGFATRFSLESFESDGDRNDHTRRLMDAF